MDDRIRPFAEYVESVARDIRVLDYKPFLPCCPQFPAGISYDRLRDSDIMFAGRYFMSLPDGDMIDREDHWPLLLRALRGW